MTTPQLHASPLCSDFLRQSGFAMLESAYAAVLVDVILQLSVSRGMLWW